jgi:hypothetical protein
MTRTWAVIAAISYAVMIAVSLIRIESAGAVIEFVANAIMIRVKLANLQLIGADVGLSTAGPRIAMTSFIPAQGERILAVVYCHAAIGKLHGPHRTAIIGQWF